MVLAILFLCIPSLASLSMRQVTELSITISLSLISFIMLLLAVFLGSTSIWKDIERRYTFSVLSLPINRSTYLVGRFCGIALFLLLTSVLLGSIACIIIKIASGIYPPTRPLVWSIIFSSILFDALKYILLVAVAILLSTVSTSFFLPVFGTISAYLAGTITQQVYDYLHSPTVEKTIPFFVKQGAMVVYYLLPNLSAFDLKVNAIYAIPLKVKDQLITMAYFGIYTAILLAVGVLLLERREMK